MRIDKGVPLPERNNLRYPWDLMDAGDSVLLPFNGREPDAAQRRYFNSANLWLKRNRPELKVITRREKNGVRVWFAKKD